MRPDPALNYLRGKGFTALRIPNTSTAPLHLLLKTGGKELTRLGTGGLGSILQASPDGPPLPAIVTGSEGPLLSGLSTSSIERSIGLNLLSGILGALAGTALNVEAGYQRARKVEFEFADVIEDEVDILELDAFAGQARLSNNAGPTTTRQLTQDDIYVVTSVLKSRKFIVAATASDGAGIDLDVPVIKQIAGAKLGVDDSAAASGRVSYQGEEPVVFGVKAVRMFYDRSSDGRQSPRFRMLKPMKANKATVRSVLRGETPPPPPEEMPFELLSVEGAFARLDIDDNP